MPNAAVLFGQNLTGGTTYPYLVTVGPVDVTQRTDLHSLEFQDNGVDEPGRLTARLWDASGTIAVPESGVVRIHESSTDQQVWLGYLTRRWYDRGATGRWINLEAVSVSAMLDEILVPFEDRPAESDRARVLYLWGKYARYPLTFDPTYVVQTEPTVAADKIVDCTLRTALYQVAGLTTGTVPTMAVDMYGQLHWFAAAETNDAPFNVNAANPPGSGNIAVDNLRVDRDGTIKNRAYIRGGNSLGSGWEQDQASVDQYGPRETYIDAPSSDTAAKRRTIGAMYFGRMAQPRTRGEFRTQTPNDGWRAGQNVVITDALNDLSAESFRIARVTTTYYRGDGKKKYHVEFGGVRPRGTDTTVQLFGVPTESAPLGGSGIGGDIGGPEIAGVSVSDGAGVQRVLLGKISNTPDYGLKVVSSDGSTVIIDGTSNMFKIVATGTMSLSISGLSVSTSVTLTGITRTDTPAMMHYLSFSNAASDAPRYPDKFIDWTDDFVANTSGGAVTKQVFVNDFYAQMWGGIDGSNHPFITLGGGQTLGTFTMYGRYYVLDETAF